MHMKLATKYGLDQLQKSALSIMAVLMVVTFLATNLQALLWQSSQWLVTAVLPAVVVELTNDERADLAKAPLSRSATLDAAAKMKAQHMAKQGYFAHYAPDGTSPWYWFDQAGYVYAHAGENLAIHFTDSSEVVEAWMDSPKHRENIVNGVYTEIGVGTAKGKFEGFDTVYVVQLFGTPAQTVSKTKVAKPVDPAPQVPKVIPVPVPPAPVQLALNEDDEIQETVLAEETPKAPLVSTEKPLPASSSTPASTTASTSLATTKPKPPVVPATISEPKEEVVVLETTMIATSSGLAVATVTGPAVTDNNSLFGLATKPNIVLQSLYLVLGILVVSMLAASVVIESRRKHYPQVAYSFVLLLGMAGLWYVHSVLTTGAVII